MNLQLTRSQRLTAYLILQAEIEEMRKTSFRFDAYHYGDCRLAGGLCDVIFILFETNSCCWAMEELGLTELLALKPKKLYSDLWWFERSEAGWDQREELLAKAIRRAAR